MKTFKRIFFILALFIFNNAQALSPDSIYMSNIKTVRLFQNGDQLTQPIITLNGNERLELHFDDLDADVKNYYYTYQLCNYDWQPVMVGTFDYIKGFSQNRISDYRFSSVALTRYTHYRVTLPQNNSYLTKSGNYILKVYLNGDTSQVAFTKRMMVLNAKATIAAKVTQPFAPEFFHTHQKVQFNVDIKGLNSFNVSQEIKVVVLQNFRWDMAMADIKPAFIRGTTMEFNSETSGVFEGGKEWRWLDLRDFHLQSDRVLTADYNKNSTEIFLKPDFPLSGQRYVYYRDFNGRSIIEAIRGINPYFEGDYATVNFSFIPPNGSAYTNKDIYLYGQLMNYEFSDRAKMVYNPQKGKYESSLLLKQGYYDYTYVAVDKDNPSIHQSLDGNYYETENVYTILVYYRPFTGRSDELIGVSVINSRTDQPGFSF